MPFRRDQPRRALAALGLLALTACSAAEAAPDAAAPVATYEPHPALAIVDRLASAPAGAVADVTGLEPDAATQRLRKAGLRVQVVAFDAGPVTAQYPEPGAAPPADGTVVVWTGTPPAPPPPPEPVPDPPADGEGEPRPEAAAGAAAQPEPAARPPGEAPQEAAARPQPPPQPETATPVPGTPAPGTPAPEPPPAEPTPPRTNPGRLPPSAPGTVLEGPASWYGPGFAGRTTACGSTFDPAALTLATRELRCGTRVRVTGPSGASTEAVVTDWGPAEWTGRRFDLSQATFAAVHPLGAGVARVTVEVVDP